MHIQNICCLINVNFLITMCLHYYRKNFLKNFFKVGRKREKKIYRFIQRLSVKKRGIIYVNAESAINQAVN